MKRSILALSVLSLSLLPGCSESVTQLVVTVDTQLMVPEQVNSIRIGVFRANADSDEQFDFGIYDVDSLPLRVAVKVPQQLLDEEGNPLEPGEPLEVMLRVAGSGPGLRNAATTEVNAEFLEGASLDFPVTIGEVCWMTSCPRGQSCGPDGCVPIADLTPPVMAYEGDDLDELPSIPPPMTTEE